MFEAGTLEELALSHAFASLAGSEGPLIPLLFVDTPDGLQVTRLVCDASDRAFEIGHAQVRERAGAARAYCLVVEAYVRIDGERKDAFLVEIGRHGEARALKYAQVFAPSARGPTRVDQPLLVGEVDNALVSGDPGALPWGAITPDIYAADRQLAVHVVNHELGSPQHQDRTVRFLRARMRHHARHLPEGTQQGIHVDDRGQTLFARERTALRARLEGAAFIRFTSEEAN